MLNTSNNQFAFPVIGALGGGYAYSTMGGIGLVGSFGGVGLGLFSMTAIGAIASSALYGGLWAIETGDSNAYLATGMGVMAGIGLYNTIGGVGLGVGGTALGLGLGTMALSGGAIGLGVYGLTMMFNQNYSVNKYYENAYFLETITREYYQETFWKMLETDEEFNQLVVKLKDKIDYQKIHQKRLNQSQVLTLKQQKNSLLNQLKIATTSHEKLELLNQIDSIEKQINSIFLL